MSIDVSEIKLSLEQKRTIAERAAQNGQPWQTVLQDAITPNSAKEDQDLDTAFLALIAEEQKELKQVLGHEPISIEEARKILTKVPGSMAGDIIADRENR